MISSDKEFIEQQEQLQTQAKRLLESSGVTDILSKYGKIIEGGSYVYGLMSHPDIDLGVISDSLHKESFGEMVGKIATLVSVRKVKTSDRVNHTHERVKAMKGYWIGVEMDFESTTWHLDIWYQKPEWQNDNTAEWEEKLSKLTSEQRTAILRTKEELRAQGRYGVGKEFVAVDVYQAMLENRPLQLNVKVKP